MIIILSAITFKASAASGYKSGIFDTGLVVFEKMPPSQVIDNNPLTGIPSGSVEFIFKEPQNITNFYIETAQRKQPLSIQFYGAKGETLLNQELFTDYGFDFSNSANNVKRVVIYSSSNIQEIEFHVKSPYFYILNFTPAHNRTDVNINEKVVLTCDANPANIDFSVTPSVEGEVTYLNNQFIFTPTKGFEYDTEYKFMVNSGKATDGRVMPGTSANTFRTVKDTSFLEVLSIKPPPDSTNVPIDQKIDILFNKYIDGNTLSEVKVLCEGSEVGITKTVNQKNLYISFDELLENEKKYVIQIKGVKDILGNPMALDVNAEFTTMLDTSELTLVSYKPPSGVVPLNQTIELNFNKNVNPSNFTYVLKDKDGNEVTSTFNVLGKKVTITPVLKPSHSYILTGVKASKVEGELQDIPLELKFDVMATSGNDTYDGISSSILNFFDYLRINGLNLFKKAVWLLLIFISAIWLWKKLVLWLHLSGSSK